MHRYVKVSENIRKLAADASGTTSIEYALIASLIAVAIIVAVGLVGDVLQATFQTVGDEIAGAQ